MDNLQTLRCTIAGLKTVNVLVLGLPFPVTDICAGMLVANAYSGSNSQHPVLWQQLPLIKYDMSGIHNLNFTKEWTDSMNHFVSCHVLRRSEKDWPHASLESCCFLDHSLIFRGSKALRDPILTPCLMVKITAPSSLTPTALVEISHQLESHNFLRDILFPWLKRKKEKKTV